MVNSKAKAHYKRTKLSRKYGASAKKSATTLQAVVRRAVAQSISKNIETKHSCYSNTDGQEIFHNNFITLNDRLLYTSQGTSDPDTTYTNNRIGDKISWNSLTIRGSIVGADDWNVVRIMLVQWKEDDQSDPITFGNVLEDTTRPWKSAYNHDYGFKFSVLYDRRFRVANNTAGQGNNLVNFMIRKKPRGRFMARTIKYVGSTVYGRGKLFLMMVTDSTAGSHPSIDYYSRLSYTDA